jgi:hypothetical protein
MKKQYLLSSIFCLSSAVLVAQQGQTGQMAQPEKVTTMPHQVITPAVAPRVDNGVGGFITADFIWWKTHIGQMEYALNGIIDNGLPSNGGFVQSGTSTRKGHVKQPEFDFEPGFKVGAGLDFEHDGWDLYANYTWLRNKQKHNHLNGESGKGAQGLTAFVAPGTILSPGAIVGGFNIITASSIIEQHFNSGDLELGRNFFISKYLTLRPHVGLKGAYISDELKLYYTPTGGLSGVGGEAVALGFNFGRQHKNQRMWGVGTRAGLNSVWHFGKNWGLYGNIALTAFWSDFHVTSRDEVTLPDGSEINTLNTHETFQEVTSVVETGIGLAYMTWFCDDSCAFDLRAGWEEQIWMDFNRFVDVGDVGNLSLHGLTIKAGVAF